MLLGPYEALASRVPFLIQQQTFRCVPQMSALPPKADIRLRNRHVRFVPKADIAESASSPQGRPPCHCRLHAWLFAITASNLHASGELDLC
jgi:hypothetical protein